MNSIFSQELSEVSLKKILVIIDASTDNTLGIVKSLQSTHPEIEIIVRKKRAGKASALNMMYLKTRTDYLLTIDADLVLGDPFCISKLVTHMEKNKKLLLTSTRHAPLIPNTLMGKFAAYSYLILENTTRKINNGNNFYSVMGMEMMPKKFYKSFTLPKGTLSDQCYVYATAISKQSDGFLLVKDACTYFMPVQTFHDWMVLSVRSTRGDKNDVVSRFGHDILSRYSIPKLMYAKSVLKFFLLSPVYTTGAILMEILIRLFPYKKNVVSKGIWEITTSSKQLLNL
jgi:glycosyltransferase involved in cell wall biosynthesis